MFFHRYKKLRDIFWVILIPCAFLWAIVTYLRRKFYLKSKKFNSFIICVGNIHSGGSGKTPIVIEICNKLLQHQPIIVSRGYKKTSSVKEDGKLDPSIPSNIYTYGDEPWLIAKRFNLPVYVGKNRIKLISKIEENFGKSLIVMDDGFQYLKLKKDFSIVCINTNKIVEESFCIPYGELREPFSALKHASAVILIYNKEGLNLSTWKEVISRFIDESRIFTAQKKIDGLYSNHKLISHEIEKAGCFCGIAEPDAFFKDVENICNVSFKRAFKDHHKYTEKDIAELIKLKETTNVQVLITTEKDWHKIVLFNFFSKFVVTLRISYSIEESFWSFLFNHVSYFKM